MTVEESIRLYGTSEPQPETHRLRAGDLSCDFEGGGLRHVYWGPTEIARGISYLFRDRDWGTVPAEVLDVVVQEDALRFELTFRLEMKTPDGSLCALASVQGDACGHLTFAVTATPDSDLTTNRCGFVVLHPASCAGRNLAVGHTDGKVEETRFPREISPSQPVFDIRSLTYSPADGLTLSCRLQASLPHDSAGKFEMEDQRNWSDASFKTYVASLLDPWPYQLPAGVALTQSVDLEVMGRSIRHQQVGSSTPVSVPRLGKPLGHRMPSLGIGVPAGLSVATAGEHEELRKLGAGWWIVDATLDEPRLLDDLRALAELRRSSASRIQLDVVAPALASPDEAARRAADLCRTAQIKVDALRVLPSALLESYQPSDVWPDVAPLERWTQAARRCFPEALIGGGMFTYFTELNRMRPASEGLDFIGHATCPIVHAADDASVMETMEALDAITGSVRKIWPHTPYRLGPSTIASPRNPYGAGPARNLRRQRLALADFDPRHCGQFGAAWTAGYVAAVAHAGLEVLALHHSHGPCGPFAGEERRVPAWRVMEILSASSGAEAYSIEGLGPGLSGIAWVNAGKLPCAMLANLTAAPISAALEGGAEIGLGAFEVLLLDRLG
jgi:hypothetical protein